jgi:hypothetical protein
LVDELATEGILLIENTAPKIRLPARHQIPSLALEERVVVANLLKEGKIL